MMSEINDHNGRGFPKTAGIFLGVGLGGFFDGIILHQVLQWHHMLTTAGYPIDSITNLQVNTLWDGLFHLTTYIFTFAGLLMMWRAARQPHAPWSGKMLAGTLLLGHGIFNVVEGIIDHHILGIHHVNELVEPGQWIYWDVGFLIWGVVMVVGGWLLLRGGQSETAAATP